MNDSEMRGVALKKFYDRRRDFWYAATVADFGTAMTWEDLASICNQLAEHGLINWKSVNTGPGEDLGIGRITAQGIDVYEGNATPGISIQVDSSEHIPAPRRHN